VIVFAFPTCIVNIENDPPSMPFGFGLIVIGDQTDCDGRQVGCVLEGRDDAGRSAGNAARTASNTSIS
jgi:hypothetical protein